MMESPSRGGEGLLVKLPYSVIINIIIFLYCVGVLYV